MHLRGGRNLWGPPYKDGFVQTSDVVGMNCNIRSVTPNSIDDSGFRGWWNPTNKLLGSLSMNGSRVLQAFTSPWDGVPRGAFDIVVHCTDRQNSTRVCIFFGFFDRLSNVAAQV